MIVRHLPGSIGALIFDMDGTLYSHAAYFRYQETSQVARLARHLSLSESDAAALLERAREARHAAGQPKTSVARLFLSFGVDMATIIKWREEEIRPAEWLTADPRLDRALAQLSARFSLALLTNNPRSVGMASAEALGIASRFDAIVGLDDTYESKPAPQPFLKTCGALCLAPQACVSIGDRMDVDIEPALALGMGGILVDGVDDVYRLPEFLAGRSASDQNPAKSASS